MPGGFSGTREGGWCEPIRAAIVATIIILFLWILVDRWPSWVGGLEDPSPWNGRFLVWLKLLLFPLLAFSLSSRFDGWFDKKRLWGLCAAFAVCLFAAVLALRPGLNAGFGPTDDHELVEWLMGREHLPIAEWWTVLLSTDFGSFGEGSSFRPLYYVFRVSECCLYGSDVGVWYGARMVYCAVTLTILWATARRYLGATLAFWSVLAILGAPSSSEIFSRLGVGETFVMPFLALGIWGLVELVRSALSSEDKVRLAEEIFLRGWLPAGLGLALIAGIKEVCFPLSCLGWLVALFVFVFPGKSNARSRWSLALLIVWALWLCFMALGILKLVKGLDGEDLYGNEVMGAGAVEAAVVAAISGLRSLLIFFGFLIAFVAVVQVSGQGGWKRLPKLGELIGERRGILSLVLILLGAWISQAMAYRDSKWLDGERYDGPAVVLFLMLTVGVVSSVSKRWTMSTNDNISWTGRLLGFCLLVSLMFSSVAGINSVNARTAESSRMTREFSDWIQSLTDLALENPSRTIVLVPDKAFQHYEPIAGTAKYFRVSGVSNRIAFTTEYIRERSGLDGRMLEALEGEGYEHAELINGKSWPANAIVVAFGSDALSQLRAEGRDVFGTTYDEVRW